MSNQPNYPLPLSLITDAENLMEDIPDRGDTVFLLRKFMGRIYAEGYADGQLVAQIQRQFDRRTEQ